MLYLAVSSDVPGADWDGVEATLRDEAAHVWSLTCQEIVRSIWFTEPDRQAVLVFESPDEMTARTTLDSFPLVRAGLIVFTLTRLVPYTGFERLFTSTQR